MERRRKERREEKKERERDEVWNRNRGMQEDRKGGGRKGGKAETGIGKKGKIE